jgi:DHHC palmitoyltransferase
MFHVSLGTWLLFHCFYHYIQAMHKGPGHPIKPKRKKNGVTTATEVSHRNENENENESEIRKTGEGGGDVTESNNEGKIENEIEKDKMCTTCKIPKEPRSHHCKICRNCSLKMDHHCMPLSSLSPSYANFHFYLIFYFILYFF